MELICKRNQHTAVNMSNELINFTQMSWSGTKLTRSSETEGSGSTEPEHSSTRQIFLLFDLKSRVRQNILLPGKSFFHTKWKIVARITEVHPGRGKLREESWNVPSLHRDGGQHHPGNTLTRAALKEFLESFTNSNFADNWICCNQTDGAWQTPVVGEILLLIETERTHSQQWRLFLSVFFSVAAVRGDCPSKEVPRRSHRKERPGQSPSFLPYHNVNPILFSIQYSYRFPRWSRVGWLQKRTRRIWKLLGFPVRSQTSSSSSTIWPMTGDNRLNTGYMNVWILISYNCWIPEY